MDTSLAAKIFDAAWTSWIGLFPHPSVALVAVVGLVLGLGLIVKQVKEG